MLNDYLLDTLTAIADKVHATELALRTDIIPPNMALDIIENQIARLKNWKLLLASEIKRTS